MENNLIFPKKPYKTKGGVKAPHRKNTASCESKIMSSPKSVIISMNQHIGSACVPTVKPGDEVFVGQIIGDSDKYVSSPIHSSVSGKVTKITKVKEFDGTFTEALEIESDGLMTPYPKLKIPNVTDLKSLLKAVRESGLVGLGGAGFPAHIKLNIPDGKIADTLIINCAECEPYITADHREAIENSWDVLNGIYTLIDLLKIERVIIAIENNKPDAIKILRKIADNKERDPLDKVRVLPLKSSYPQGAEKVLIQACTGRKVPIGKLPIDVGCIVMNITSVAFLARYLKTGMPLVSKRITVDGSAVNTPSNVIAPIGTSIKDIIEFCGGYKTEPKKIIMGGPMMGSAVYSDEMTIKKQTNAILAFNEKEALLSEPTDCIRCGKCAEACPMNLMPPMISNAVKNKNIDALEKLSALSCMECGCCAFSCPANKHIVQQMRSAKILLKEAQKEKRGN